MAHPHHHAVSSTRKFGGEVADYLPIHLWFDETKALIGDFRHRALRHHAAGIYLCQEIFGVTIRSSAGREIPVRWIAEQHVTEDHGVIPEAADWLRTIHPEPWMMRGAPVGLEPGEGGTPYKHRRSNDARCRVCGGPAEAITLVCDRCANLLATGHLREELIDGEFRYRHWRREWTPGGLVERSSVQACDLSRDASMVEVHSTSIESGDG